MKERSDISILKLSDEFKLISAKHNSKIKLQRTWSVVYSKGHYHVPHNHGSKGYCGILYLDMH